MILIFFIFFQNVAYKDIEVLLQEKLGRLGTKDDPQDAQGLEPRLSVGIQQKLKNGSQEIGPVVEKDVEQLLPPLSRHELLAIRVALVEVALFIRLELLGTSILGKFLDDDHDALDTVVVLKVHLFRTVHK